MNHKDRVHELFDLMAKELLAFIAENESNFSQNWVPATYIKDKLSLKLSAYPQGNKIDNKTGWLFSTLARYLQDQNLVNFMKNDKNRSFYKCRNLPHKT